MKKQNFKLQLRFLSSLIVLAIVFTVVPTSAASFDSQAGKILFVTDATEYSRMISADVLPYDDVMTDVATLNNIDVNMVSNYEAVVLPFGEETNVIARTAYENGSVVYLYGELSIQDYKKSVGVENYALTVPIYKTDGTIGEVVQFFDATYEENEIFNVISYSDYALLCKISQEIPDDLVAVYEQQESISESVDNIYLTAVENNFSALKSRAMARTVVDSDFDITNYFGPDNAFSVHLDYTLHQNDSDRDPDYDYFGIKTRIWVDNNSGMVSRLQTKYELPYSSDNLLETGPTSQSNVGELTVEVGYGESGPSGSISYSIDLSDTNPTIHRTVDYTNDIVEWEMTPRTILPIYLDGDNFDCCATWASSGSSFAAVDVFYAGRVNVGPDGIHPVDSGYDKVQVRFRY